MKYLNKIATFLCSAALGMLAMTSCEGGDLYGVDSPDWLQNKIDSIEASKPTGDIDLPAGEEDVYTIGKTDFSSGWWADFSKYYVIPANAIWNAVFTLNINPAATNTYKNFALILTNDVDRGGDGYIEYGAIRFDYQPSGNSEWGEHIVRENATSTLMFQTDTDPGVDKLGGRVILSIDRANGGLNVNMTNGTVTKNYTHPGALPNLNNDPANENIRAFLVVEGSYINFMQSNLEPIGGFTSAEDKQPLSMQLSGVPDEVLVGETTIEDIQKSLSATITFEQGVTKQANGTELVVDVVEGGDLTTVGEKTLAIIYNKTFKGANCDKPIAAVAKIKVVNELSAYTEKYVCPSPTILGAEDNSTGWWAAHTANIKVEPRQTAVVSFTNYTPTTNNWNNFVTVLCNSDGTKEYAVVRADNFGWGDGYAACTPALDPMPENDDDWAEWRAAMDGAKVTEYITNNGDGTANVKAIMYGTNGKVYVQTYTGINKVDKDNMYFNFTVDSNHLVFDTVVGEVDNSTPWWSAFTQNIQIPAHTVFTTSFINYTSGANNWNNFCVILNAADVAKEYAVVRADNFGWGDGYAACTPAGTQGDWAEWLGAMNGAKVDLTIINNGNGLVDVTEVFHGTNGVDYTQTYTGINKVDPNDLYFRLVMDGSHVEFNPSVSQAKRNAIQLGKKR